MCLCDLDGDGDADVLSSSIHDNRIAWYENLQNGTGLNTTSYPSFSLSPNPAYHHLILTRPYPAAEAGFVITDLSGRELLHKNLSSDIVEEIDISMLQAGIYFCKLAGSNGVQILVVVE